MSQENVEIVRRAMDANRSGGLDDAMELFAEGVIDADCEFASRISSIEGSTYRGREGFRHYLEDMEDAFQEWHNDVNEVSLVAPDIVLVDVTFRGTGQSGVAVELQSFAVCVFSGAKIVRLAAHPTRTEALEAAGLSERGDVAGGRGDPQADL